MKEILGRRDPFLLRGVMAMAVVVAFYSLMENPSLELTGLYAAMFVVGAILSVGSPTRWSVSTTLRLYQAVPLLFGISTVTFGGYYLVTTDVSVLSAVVLGWGVFSLVALVVGPWDEVESHLEKLKAQGTEPDDAALPLPRPRFLQFRYATVGLVIVTAAVVMTRLIVHLDLGVVAILVGIGGAGLVNILCSPYSGPPERIVHLRQARWAVLGAGTGASSLYGALVVDATVPAAFWAVVTLGVAYWAVVRTSWDEVRDSVAAAQSGAEGTVD